MIALSLLISGWLITHRATLAPKNLSMHSMHLPFSWPAVIAAGSFHMSALAESDVKF